MTTPDYNEITELKKDIRSLTTAVMELTVNVATQTSTLSGFKELYQVEIQNINKKLVKLDEIRGDVDNIRLYIAEREGKEKTLATLIKTGWAAFGLNIIAFITYLVKEYIMNGGGNG